MTHVTTQADDRQQSNDEQHQKRVWVTPAINQVGKVREYVKAVKRSGSADNDVGIPPGTRRPLI